MFYATFLLAILKAEKGLGTKVQKTCNANESKKVSSDE